MRSFAAPLLLLSLPTQAAPPTASFHDDALHLTYAYPSNFIDATALATTAFQTSLSGQPAVASEAKCLALPFSRMAPPTQDFAMVILIHAQAACLKKNFTAASVAELAQGEAQGLAATGAKTSFGQPQTFQLATRPAARIEGAFTLPTGQTMQAAIVCVLDQPDIACWQFLAQTPAALRTLQTQPVTFDGSPAAPLTPDLPSTK